MHKYDRKPRCSSFRRAMQLAAAAATLLGTLVARADPPDKFLFGANFNPSASDQVKSLFYESGMNCVRLTGGGYGWATAAHKKLADDFQARGLMVYLQLGSHYPSGAYLDNKNAYFVDQDGKTGTASRKTWAVSYSFDENWPQYSYADQKFRKQLEGDFTTYLKSFSTNTNIAGVILHNEAGFFWITDRIFDYGAPAVAKFREYLQAEHGTIEALNQCWGSHFASFAELTPPGKPPFENVAAWMDWRRYSAAQIADFMSWEAGFFKSQRTDVPRTTNLSGPLDHWLGYRLGQNDILTEKMDVAGIDIYPSTWSDRVFVPYSMDMTQGVAQGRPVHVLECDVFGQQRWKDYSEDQRADMLRGELWTMIGHGARAMLLWGFSSNGEFTLTDGEFNPRLLACRDIAHAAKMINLDGYTRSRPAVAVCVDPDSYLYASAIEAKPNELGPMEDAEAHGIYAALADSHIPSDVILTGQLQTGAWKNYRAIILAGARMMDDKTARELDAFVASGGLLIADGPLAEMDHWGKPSEVQPGAALDRVFGIRTGQTRTPRTTVAIGTAAGKVLADAPQRQVQLNGAVAIATLPDGSPAMTSNQYGKGQAIFLDGRVGIPSMTDTSAGLSHWLTSVLEPVAQTPRVLSDNARQIDTSMLRDEKGNLLIVASSLGNKGKIAPVVANAELSIATGQPQTKWQAYVLAATQEHNGTVSSGPQALPIAVDKSGIPSLALGDVASSTPVLLLTDATPLLAISSPAHASRGQEITVTATCSNPSSRAVDAAVSLQVAGQPSGKPADVSIAAYQQAVVRIALPIAPDAAIGRAVVSAMLKMKDSGKEIAGVPVDVQVDEEKH